MLKESGPIYVSPCSLNNFLKWVISPHPPPPAQNHEHKRHTGCQVTIDIDRQTHEGPFVTESHSWRTGTFQMSWSHLFNGAKGLQELIPSMFLPEGSLKGDALG